MLMLYDSIVKYISRWNYFQKILNIDFTFLRDEIIGSYIIYFALYTKFHKS